MAVGTEDAIEDKYEVVCPVSLVKAVLQSKAGCPEKKVHDHGIRVALEWVRLSRGTVDDGIVLAMPHYYGLRYVYMYIYFIFHFSILNHVCALKSKCL